MARRLARSVVALVVVLASCAAAAVVATPAGAAVADRVGFSPGSSILWEPDADLGHDLAAYLQKRLGK